MGKGKIASLILAAGMLIGLTSYSPYIPSYGGTLWFTNDSSYTLLLEFLGRGGGGSAAYTIESKLYIEPRERLPVPHNFLDKEAADPNVFFKRLSVYDANTGTLLKELPLGEALFILERGSIDSNTAEFSFPITDALVLGGT
jgi:hypothetical protein